MPDDPTSSLDQIRAELRTSGATYAGESLLLKAIEAVLELHVLEQSVIRHICKRHGAGIGTARTMAGAEWRDEVDACPDCRKVDTPVCAHCTCPNDAWPCKTYRAITAALTGTQQGEDREHG